MIGGHSFTILLDCDDQYLHDRLVLRGAAGEDRIDDNVQAIEKKLAFFAKNTLPLLKAIEDEEKLIVVDGDRDEDEIFYDIVKTIDFSLYGVELEEAGCLGCLCCKANKIGHADEAGLRQESDVGNASQASKRGQGKSSDEVDAKPEVVEEEMTSATATITGGDGGNPEYSAQLDALGGGKDAVDGGEEVDGVIDDDDATDKDAVVHDVGGSGDNDSAQVEVNQGAESAATEVTSEEQQPDADVVGEAQEEAKPEAEAGADDQQKSDVVGDAEKDSGEGEQKAEVDEAKEVTASEESPAQEVEHTVAESVEKGEDSEQMSVAVEQTQAVDSEQTSEEAKPAEESQEVEKQPDGQ
ncbi:ump-cmp kinase [Plakobranchus ocellatus]|uniref:Ump-cmp kinase n=1 Tax=Plakobranchus ocellatus TaxID=259542 RepID=A0AAV3Y488_9GAST|nr:ump-cmp kinase [Plakobranchus ocellatus]